MRKTLLALAIASLVVYFGGIAKDSFAGAMSAHVAKIDRATSAR